ncbi:MAG: GTP 3',8-cyclase MoaA [Cyclobacteriaceae bacterium]
MSALFDNHGRPLNYLRLAVTDRCNLRCFYCMPEEGIQYMPKKELLTFEEILTLVSLMASMGINKLRLTGGEPFVRNDLMELIKRLVEIPGIKDIHLTTNGILTAPHIPALKKLGISSVNLSLDTLDKQRFKTITRRDEFDNTFATLKSLLHHEIPVKINTVVMDGKNIEDIIPIVELTKKNNVTVRFIEEMPFNGEGNHHGILPWNYKQILQHIQSRFKDLQKMPDPENSTAFHYKVPGFSGSIGIIAAFSRTFCGTCNRLRVTAQGTLKTCLYDDGVLDIKALLRSGISEQDLKQKLLRAFSQRAKDGFEAEKKRNDHQPAHESMSTIGG